MPDMAPFIPDDPTTVFNPDAGAGETAGGFEGNGNFNSTFLAGSDIEVNVNIRGNFVGRDGVGGRGAEAENQVPAFQPAPPAVRARRKKRSAVSKIRCHSLGSKTWWSESSTSVSTGTPASFMRRSQARVRRGSTIGSPSA